jgi:hypothetical protein
MDSITNDDLYKVLVKLDHDHRIKFNNHDVDDKTYFRLALEEELISSALSIVINSRMRNLRSPGVMGNCRLVYESLAMLSKLDKGQINADQLHIFRTQYFIVEYNNYKKLLLGENPTEQDMNTLRQKYEETLDSYVKTLGVKKNDIKFLVRDPMFVLYEKGKGTITPTQLVESVYGPDAAMVYKVFSILEHPFFGLNVDDTIAPAVNTGINQVMALVISYFRLSGESFANPQGPSLNEELDNPIYKPKIDFILGKTGLMYDLTNSLSDLGRGVRDNFNWYFMNVFTRLYLDISVCVALGFSEQACLKFKPLIEIYSAFYNIQNQPGPLKAFYAKKAAYDIGSEFSIANLLEQSRERILSSRDDELKKAYDDYYHAAYKVDFATFKKNLISNNLYFLKQDGKNYDGMVKDFVASMPVAETVRNAWLTIYSDSKDIGHTGGFLFDCDKGPWQNDAPLVIGFFNTVFLDHLINVNEALISHGMVKHLEDKIQLFKKTIDAENAMFSGEPLSKDDLS